MSPEKKTPVLRKDDPVIITGGLLTGRRGRVLQKPRSTGGILVELTDSVGSGGKAWSKGDAVHVSPEDVRKAAPPPSLQDALDALEGCEWTCDDPDNRRGPLFCPSCGGHALQAEGAEMDCPCEGCEDEDAETGEQLHPAGHVDDCAVRAVLVAAREAGLL